MQKNKFITYLLYAIGEIFLVVIGILIAVSLNNWNQERQNKKAIQSILRELKVDLRKDVLRGQEIMDFYREKNLLDREEIIDGKLTIESINIS